MVMVSFFWGWGWGVERIIAVHPGAWLGIPDSYIL